VTLKSPILWTHVACILINSTYIYISNYVSNYKYINYINPLERINIPNAVIVTVYLLSINYY
jgi:hypothetical protein